MPATYKNIRDAIEQIAGSDVGFYSISQGQVKAIMVVPPEPKATWTPTGLEIIIKRNPTTEDEGMHSGIKRKSRWEIILNQWDRNDFDSLKKVRDKITKEFGIRAKFKQQEQTASTYERCSIFIDLQNYIRTTENA